MLPCRVRCKAAICDKELVVVGDELVGQLPESNILCLELGFDELAESRPCLFVVN